MSHHVKLKQTNGVSKPIKEQIRDVRERIKCLKTRKDSYLTLREYQDLRWRREKRTKEQLRKIREYRRIEGFIRGYEKKLRRLKRRQELKRIRSKAKGKEITRGLACKLVACEPTIKKFRELIKHQDRLRFPPETIEKTETIIKRIEKRAFKLHLFPTPRIVIGAAIYLLEKTITYEDVKKVVHCSQGGVSSLIRKLQIKRGGI
jgi:hypothetical protein